MGIKLILNADQVGLITYALKDYLACRGAATDADFVLDYNMTVAQMDADTLATACTDALRAMCLRHAPVEEATFKEPLTAHDMRGAIYSLMLDFLGIKWALANMPRGIDNVPDTDLPVLYAQARRDAEAAIIADARREGVNLH